MKFQKIELGNGVIMDKKGDTEVELHNETRAKLLAY
jgi:hypothetical protein